MAGRIPEEFISEVRSNVNIVDVIGQFVSLEKKGKDYIGLCPFHQEKTPSFTVNEEKQFFKCFGCGKGGNVFKFLMYLDNLTFPESVARVADYAHIPMPTGVGDAPAPLNPLMKIHQEATKFYHQVLLSTKAGQKGLEYAKSRELNNELLDHFQIGYAPKQDNLLLTFLHDKGYKDDDLAKTGLFVQSQDGRLFDRFRDRLMFPLTDESGRVVAFSGRRISDDPEEPKYLNSPETEIFDKSASLFHFAEAKKAAREENHLVLYEGYMDVISAYKAGVHSGIASMGTSLTTQQIYLIKRTSRNIVINYDGDDPGIHAAERASHLFEQADGFNIEVVVLPDKLDPDEYIKKFGNQKYQDRVAGAYTSTQFYLSRLAKKYPLNDPKSEAAYVNEAISIIAALKNPTEQDIYINQLANEQDLSKSALRAQLMHERRRIRRAERNKNFQNDNLSLTTEQNQYEETDKLTYDYKLKRLLFLYMHSSIAREKLRSINFVFPDSNYQKVINYWNEFEQKANEKSESLTVQNFTDFAPSEFQGIISDAEMDDMPEDFSDKEINDILSRFNDDDYAKQLKVIKTEIMHAEQNKDHERAAHLMMNLLELKRKLKSYG